MQEENAGDEAETLAVPDLGVSQRVGLQHVEEGELACPQLGAEEGVGGERPPYTRRHTEVASTQTGTDMAK